MAYWLIKSGKPDMWDIWADQGLISVGWDVGPTVEEPWNEFRARVKDRFDTENNHWAGNAVSAIKALAGTHRRSSLQMQTGDTVIIIGTEAVYGYAVIRGVARVGEFEFKKEGVSRTGDHTYTRKVAEWLYGQVTPAREDEGPVPKVRLDEQFQMGEKDSLHVASTIKRAKFNDEATLNVLVEQLRDAETVEEPGYNLRVSSERAMEEYLKENIQRLDSELDPDRVHSQRLITKESRVDLYCFYTDDGPPVVVELKKGEAGSGALKQLRRYLNKEQENREAVTGMLVAENFSPAIRQRAAEMDDVELRSVEIDLRFEPIAD